MRIFLRWMTSSNTFFLFLVRPFSGTAIGREGLTHNIAVNKRGFHVYYSALHYAPVRVGVLKHPLVVLRQSGNVDDSGDVVKAVDPLLALVALSPHVVHLERRPVDAVLVHHDPWLSNTGQQQGQHQHAYLRRVAVVAWLRWLW